MTFINTAVLTDVAHWNSPRRSNSRVSVMRSEPEPDVVDLMAAGHEALSRGDWEQALACFETASERHPSAEAIEALAMAAWWLDNAQLAVESREHAYRLYRERGDPAAAARMAIWLGWDSLAFGGVPAVARGWLQRAHRLLEGLGPVPEHGWLALREGEFAFLLENDIAAARRFAEQARSIGTALAVPGIEFSALGLEGLALASQGHIADGIRLLDEASAAAMAGEISELWAAARTCCYMITACERVRDLQRAHQWSQRMLEFAKRWRIQDLFAVCRAHYAAILVLRGAWEEADAIFETALRELGASRPGIAFEALVRRADLRRRQGRVEEAAELFGQAEFHPDAQLGLAHVALHTGDAALAADRATRFLRKLGPENQLQRAAGLDLHARALIALGETERARNAHHELQGVAAEAGSNSLRASALAVEGLVAEADGDLDTARPRIEDAIDLFHQCGDPFETARSRLDLARVLAALGRSGPAAEQARVAYQTLAGMQAQRAGALTNELGHPAPAGTTSVLTARELDVLKLVAQGLSNTDIAHRLVLSEHTVHRHLANLLRKLDLSSRAAAAAWGTRAGLI